MIVSSIEGLELVLIVLKHHFCFYNESSFDILKVKNILAANNET